MLLTLPKGKQGRSIIESTARINLWEGSVRSGKTVASILRWLDYCDRGPDGDLLMVGKTERTLKRNILDPMQELVGNRDFALNKGQGELYLFGRRIYLAGANDERSEGKIRGLTLAGAYGDELTLWPESFFTMLMSRLSVPGAKFFGTTNPDGPNHWLKKDWIEREKDLDLRSWHFTLDDNPNLDPTYVESLKKEYVGLWHKRYIRGLWVMAEGAIYDFFDENECCIDQPPKAAYYLAAIDYGTGNPTVFGLFGVNPRGKPKVWLEREYVHDSRKLGRQKTDSEYSNDLKTFLGAIKPRFIYLDPSAASFKVQLRRDGFHQVRDADNSVLDGIRTQASMLKNGDYKIMRTCRQTIDDYSAYVWDAKAQDRGEDKPVKENDHTKDMERYALHSHFSRPELRVVAKPAGF